MKKMFLVILALAMCFVTISNAQNSNRLDAKTYRSPESILRQVIDDTTQALRVTPVTDSQAAFSPLDPKKNRSIEQILNTIIDRSTNALRINNIGGKYYNESMNKVELGDIQNTNNGTKFVVDDANQVIKLNKPLKIGLGLTIDSVKMYYNFYTRDISAIAENRIIHVDAHFTNPTNTSVMRNFGGAIAVRYNGSGNLTNTDGGIVGFAMEARNTSTANVTKSIGMDVLTANQSTGSVTTSIGVNAIAYNWGGGTITNAYNFYSKFNDSNYTNKYHFYGDGNAPSYFGGEVQHLASVLNETATEPATTQDTQSAIYIKGDKLIIKFNNGGTIKYRYLDLTSADATWTYTTTAP